MYVHVCVVVSCMFLHKQLCVGAHSCTHVCVLTGSGRRRGGRRACGCPRGPVDRALAVPGRPLPAEEEGAGSRSGSAAERRDGRLGCLHVTSRGVRVPSAPAAALGVEGKCPGAAAGWAARPSSPAPVPTWGQGPGEARRVGHGVRAAETPARVGNRPAGQGPRGAACLPLAALETMGNIKAPSYSFNPEAHQTFTEPTSPGWKQGSCLQRRVAFGNRLGVSSAGRAARGRNLILHGVDGEGARFGGRSEGRPADMGQKGAARARVPRRDGAGATFSSPPSSPRGGPAAPRWPAAGGGARALEESSALLADGKGSVPGEGFVTGLGWMVKGNLLSGFPGESAGSPWSVATALGAAGPPH